MTVAYTEFDSHLKFESSGLQSFSLFFLSFSESYTLLCKIDGSLCFLKKIHGLKQWARVFNRPVQQT